MDAGGAELDALLARARNGDGRAFGALVAVLRPRIVALALQLTGRTSDAEDVAQETFLRAYRHLSSFQARSQFSTWLYRIAVNRALSHRRRLGTAQARVRLDDDRVRAAVAVDAPEDPQAAALLAERYARLLTVLDALSPSLRATVVLVALQGLPHRDAAAVAGTSEGTIAWRMHEARRRLRRALEEDERPSRRGAKARPEGGRREADEVSGIRRRRPTPRRLTSAR